MPGRGDRRPAATLTGSIGVLGGKLVVDGLLERVGVNTGRVQRGARALMYSPRGGFSEDERARFAVTIDAIYNDFVGKVAAGRNRPVAEIEAVARGRVWTGRDAADAGLVDELGGLRDAVRIARERADLPEDAPVLGAIRIPPLARLGRPKNSEDPRTWVGTAWPGSVTSPLPSGYRSTPHCVCPTSPCADLSAGVVAMATIDADKSACIEA